MSNFNISEIKFLLIKDNQQLQNFKHVFKNTSSNLKKKFNLRYKSQILDDDANRLILQFSNLKRTIFLLSISLKLYKESLFTYIDCFKSVIICYQNLLQAYEWELALGSKNIESKDVDLALMCTTNDIKTTDKYTIMSAKSFSGSSNNLCFFKIRKMVGENKSCDMKRAYIDPKLDLESGLIKIDQQQHLLHQFFNNQLIGNLETLKSIVIDKISESIETRANLINEYNRYKTKFEKLEAKDLEADLNIIDEKIYRSLILKLENTNLQYEEYNCVVKRDIASFLNVLFPVFLNNWFSQFYYTVVSIFHMICQPLGRYLESMGFTNLDGSLDTFLSYQSIVLEYHNSMKFNKKGLGLTKNFNEQS